jgi:hypothetical protein
MASFNIYKKNNASINFVEDWLTLCKNENLLTDAPNICGLNDFKDFISHRHDQSILTLLAIQKKIKPYRDPSQYGNHLKYEKYREKGEYILKPYTNSKDYQDSNYGTILNHHREKFKTVSLFENKIMKYLIGEFRRLVYRFKFMIKESIK